MHSVLIVLRPKANASDLTGEYEVLAADGQPYLTFRYAVVRLWQESLDVFLNAGPGVAPLALLTDEAAADLSIAFTRFRNRLRECGVPDNLERGLLGSAFVLCGLRYSQSQIEYLYRDINMTLEESTTYQLILNKGITQGVAQGINQGVAQGRAEEARGLLLRLATRRFGTAPANAEQTILAISDLERLERMIERISEATGWSDLFATL